MKKPLKTPCSECPFRRDSLQGWLGSAQSAGAFLLPHYHSNLHLPCHMQVDWEGDDPEAQADEAPTCAGYAMLCKHDSKLPYNRQDCEAQDHVDEDREMVFSNPHEFFNYHNERMQP